MVSGAVVLTSAMVTLQTPLQGLYKVLLLSCLAAFFIMLLPLSFFLRRMVKPLQQMNSVALSMAQGDFTQRADESPHGEIGELANSINHLARTARPYRRGADARAQPSPSYVGRPGERVYWRWDEQGSILRTNPALYQLFGIETV